MKYSKGFISVLLVVFLIVAAMAPQAARAEKSATVKGGWIVLRATPSFEGEITASYPEGTKVTITGQSGKWYAVTTPDGKTGYMYGDYLIVSEDSSVVPAGSEIKTDGKAYVVSPNGLNVRLRTGPGTGFPIIAAYAPGTPCTVISSGVNWSYIMIGGRTGYMMSAFLTGSPIIPVQQPTVVNPSSAYSQPDFYGEEDDGFVTEEDEDIMIAQPGMTGAGYTVYVTSMNGLGVNLRSGPGTNYPSIGFFSVGTAATMITAGASWSYIRIGTQYGYMMSQFLTVTEPDTLIENNQPISGYGYGYGSGYGSGSGFTGGSSDFSTSGSDFSSFGSSDYSNYGADYAYIVSADGRNVNLRSSPSTASSVIRNFPVGTPLTIITRGTDWYFVLIDGYYGYMMRQFIYDPGQIISPTDIYDSGFKTDDSMTDYFDSVTGY